MDNWIATANRAFNMAFISEIVINVGPPRTVTLKKPIGAGMDVVITGREAYVFFEELQKAGFNFRTTFA